VAAKFNEHGVSTLVVMSIPPPGLPRFFTRAPGDAWAGRDPTTGLGSVGLITRPPAEGRPFGNFFLRIGLRGTGPGELRYVYIYERGDSTPGWHGTGPRAGQAFEVHGCIFKLYQSLGGTGSWLGFPISDEYDVEGGRRSDFENGFIFWNAQTRVCQALPYAE
jgi:hypothetical protein